MSGRTRRTMIARAFSTEVEYQTAGNYDTAGVIQYTKDGKLYRYVAAVGTSARSVARRAEKRLRQVRPETLPSDYPYMVEVVSLREVTAPVVREYFGTHTVFVTGLFTEADGWTSCPVALKAGRSDLRRLIREGYTAFGISKQNSSISRTSRWRTADFQSNELLRSMNARKKTA